jgi:hypothetical protein
MKRIIRTTAAFFAMAFVLLPSVFAQEAPHSFWDRANKVGFTISFAVRAVDAGQSCYHLRHGSIEGSAPFQSCSGVTSWIMAGQALQMGGQYLLHRTGHHKLERWIPVSAAGNVNAIARSR